MQVDIITVGETTAKYFADGIKEYEKRLGVFCTFNYSCVREEYINESKSVSEAEIYSALEAEARRIIKKLPKNTCSIALCIEGKELSSPELAAYIEKKREIYPSLSFIIGSSHGLAESLKSRCDIRLSMSRMTFPHQMARLVLTEQIYRAFSIINGKKYHK